MVVLMEYIEAVLIAQKQGICVPPGVLKTLEAMFSYLASMILPTNELFLVNDSVVGYPMHPKELLAVGVYMFKRGDWKYLARDAHLSYLAWTCGSVGVAEFERLPTELPKRKHFGWRESGYYVLRSGWSSEDTVILFDCGSLGPKHSCGHSHADALSFCLYTHGAKRIVDSGVYEYKNGPWRAYFRSTAAHNTIVLDDENQSDVWHSFRVGRMASSKLTLWQPGDTTSLVEGFHDGYCAGRKRVIHKRRLEFHEPNELRIVDDLNGGSTHTVDAMLHLVPCRVIALGSSSCVAQFDDGVALEFEFTATAPINIHIMEAWISKEWNMKFLAPCIKVSTRTTLPFRLETNLKITGIGR